MAPQAAARPASSGTDPAALVAAARGFAPDLRARGAELEAARQLAPDIAGRFAGAGFYRMAVPAALGGLETDPQTILDVIDALARADGSAAWCVMIGSTTGLTAAYLAPEAARTVFGSDPATITAGVFAPMGTAEIGGETATVSGRWAWGSGSRNAQWIFGGSRLMRDGAPVTDDAGRPRTMMFAMPASEVTIHDTWDPSGLAGTGSHDFEARGVAVPLGNGADITGAPREAGTLYAFPIFGMLALGIAAVATGLGRAAIEEIQEIGGGKRPQGSRKLLGERVAAQSEVARAEAAVASSRAYLADAVGRAWDLAQAGGDMPAEARRDLRLAASHAVEQCVGAVDRMYLLGGGSSVHKTGRLQRIFRDAHVVTQHMMVAPATWELTGRMLFGLETDTATL